MAKFQFFSLCVFLCTLALSFAEDLQNYERPIAWVIGTDSDTGELSKTFFSNDSKSAIVLRNMKDVSVHCEADYSVQLNLEGYADFRFLAAGSGSSSKSFKNETFEQVIQRHTTYVHLLSLREVYTGLYTCRGRSSQTKNNTISAYIFVPTDKLFVSTRTAKVSSADQNPILFPCPIAEPNASVSLVKLINEDTIKPIPSAVYKPREGFLLEKTPDTEEKGSKSDLELDETYFCIAKLNENVQAVEFTVTNKPVNCSKKCNVNSKCELVNDQQVCECKPTYEQTLVSEKCLKGCNNDEDCPKIMACLAQDKGSFLLDILSEGKSLSGEGRKTGACKNPCVYTNVSCSSDEVCRVVDNKASCVASI